MEAPIWLAALSSLASGLVTFVISTRFYVRHEERKQKLEVFRGLMGTRHGLVENVDPVINREFFRFLNEAYVVFGMSSCVIDAIKSFKTHPQRTSDNFTILARSMSKDLKIRDSILKDEFFNSPFVPAA